MKKKLQHVGTSLLGLVAALLMTAGLLTIFRGSVGAWVGLAIYAVVPAGILVWSIIRYSRQKSAMFLNFGISLMVSIFVFFSLAILLVVMAMKSFT